MLLALVILLFSIPLSAHADGKVNKQAEQEILERSLGKVILNADLHTRYEYSDTNPFGNAQAFVEFKKQYQKNIKNISVNLRVNYFWSALWHLGLQGGQLSQFEELVAMDCLDEFIEKLEQYVKIETNMQRNKTRLHLSSIVLDDLKRLKQIKWQFR